MLPDISQGLFQRILRELRIGCRGNILPHHKFLAKALLALQPRALFDVLDYVDVLELFIPFEIIINALHQRFFHRRRAFDLFLQGKRTDCFGSHWG